MSIWKYKDMLPPLNASSLVTLNEGQTPCEQHPELATALGVEELWLKREDANPTGSHKDRSLAYWLNAYVAQGEKSFVISSSGNSAISAIHYCHQLGCQLEVFLSPQLSHDKRTRLTVALRLSSTSELKTAEGTEQTVDNCTIHFTNKAVSEAFKYAKNHSLPLLRGSTDDLALPGFMTIAFELAESLPQATDVFIPSSSGTAAVGIYNGYKTLGGTIPRLHVVQTEAVHALLPESPSIPNSEPSIASAITDRVAHRLKQVQELIKETHGRGWVIPDDQIIDIRSTLDNQCLAFSPEGAMALAAIRQAHQKGLDMPHPVALITGR